MFHPDDISAGFVSEPVAAARYDHASVSVHDVPRLLANQIPSGAFVLDVGCGTGATIAAYGKHVACKVLGIEPDSTRAEIARSRGIEVIHGLYLPEVNVQYGPFDVIVFADVLEHLSNPAAILHVARQGLKEKGFILVSVPNVAHWSVRLALLFGNFQHDNVGIMDATHLRWFTKQSAITFFERIGFTASCVGSSVNTGLPAYNRTPIFRRLSLDSRERILKPFVSVLPGLFGCQHVFLLRPTATKL